MNKRIFSLILAMLMLSSFLFTGCDMFGSGDGSGPGDVVVEASLNAETLSMYVVCAAPVSEETAKLVEEAFNKITKVEFKTQVKLHFATYDEYYTLIEEVVADNIAFAELREKAEKALKDAKKAAKAEGVVTDDAWFDKFYESHPEYAPFRETEELTGDDTTAEQTEMVTIEGIDNSYTLSQIKYPDERPHQIDILWIDSYDRYLQYIEDEMIERLDTELSGSSKKLTEYINGELLTWAKWVSSGTYGIPNNVILGEYTYLMVNKKLAEKYSYNPDELDTLEKCADFLADIKKYEPDVAPILGEIYPTNTYFWSVDTTTGKIDSSKFCLLASTMTNRTHDPKLAGKNVVLECKNVFRNPEFTAQLKCIQTYKDAGYIYDESTNTDYAVRVIKGNADLNGIYGDEYSLNVLEYPRVSYEDVFSNMFAVSAYTRDVGRSMQIITYLNTNKDLRNVLQYGVEGVHYKIDDDTGRLVRLNHDYMMDIETTGNVFLAYPEEYMELDVWEWGKKQNLDAKPYLTIGFDFSNRLAVPEDEDPKEYTLLNTTDMDSINKLSAEVYEEYLNCRSLAELETLITKWAAYDDKKEYSFLKTQRSPAEPDEKNPVPGMYYYYYQWVQDTGLYKEVEEG
ncbi:MAG: hypothetical protein ACI3XI_07090 [Eubacteriales bacterium]